MLTESARAGGGPLLRYRIFLAILIPYLICLIGVFVFFNISIDHSMLEQPKTLVHQEFQRLCSEMTKSREKLVDYDEKIVELTEQYKFGDFGYAWLLDRKGEAKAFSQYRNNMDPETLSQDRTEILPYIKNHLPGGSRVFSTRKGKKILEYGGLGDTGYTVAVVLSVPSSTQYHFFKYVLICVFFILLFIFGFSWAVMSSKLVIEPLTYASRSVCLVSMQESFESDRYSDIPEISLITSSLERIEKMISEGKERDVNPLTGLPGAGVLEAQLFEAIDAKTTFAVGEININHFSSFNHKYGFKRGDSFIQFMAAALTGIIGEYGAKGDFIAHLGGDRFVFLTRADDIEKICDKLISRCDEHFILYYDKEDRARGFILSKDKTGEIQKCPFMTITIGIATNIKRPLIHPLQIAHITNEIIEFLKDNEVGSYLIDRRLVNRESDSVEVLLDQNGKSQAPQVSVENGASEAESSKARSSEDEPSVAAKGSDVSKEAAKVLEEGCSLEDSQGKNPAGDTAAPQKDVGDSLDEK